MPGDVQLTVGGRRGGGGGGRDSNSWISSDRDWKHGDRHRLQRWEEWGGRVCCRQPCSPLARPHEQFLRRRADAEAGVVRVKARETPDEPAKRGAHALP